MLSYKVPEAETRLLYPKLVEYGLIAALSLIIIVFLTSKKLEKTITIRTMEDVVLETEEIPVTQQVKRPPPPARPTIPVEDPEVDAEDDLAFEDIDEIDWTVEAPPRPENVAEEIVEFFLVEEPPNIKGGLKALYDYLAKNDLYPEMARKASINGDVIIGFVVDTKGNPTDVHVVAERPAGLGFGEAGMKAIQAMKFSPGYQRDRAVAVRMQQPLKFRLE
jgi:protein TonB